MGFLTRILPKTFTKAGLKSAASRFETKVKAPFTKLVNRERDQFERLLDKNPATLTLKESEKRAKYLANLQKESPIAYHSYLERTRPTLFEEVGDSLLPKAHFRTNFDHFQEQEKRLLSTTGKTTTKVTEPLEVTAFKKFKTEHLNIPINEPQTGIAFTTVREATQNKRILPDTPTRVPQKHTISPHIIPEQEQLKRSRFYVQPIPTRSVVPQQAKTVPTEIPPIPPRRTTTTVPLKVELPPPVLQRQTQSHDLPFVPSTQPRLTQVQKSLPEHVSSSQREIQSKSLPKTPSLVVDSPKSRLGIELPQSTQLQTRSQTSREILPKPQFQKQPLHEPNPNSLPTPQPEKGDHSKSRFTVNLPKVTQPQTQHTTVLLPSGPQHKGSPTVLLPQPFQVKTPPKSNTSTILPSLQTGKGPEPKVTLPPIPPRQQVSLPTLSKEPTLPTRSNSMELRRTAQSAVTATSLSVQELFGRDLKKVTFRQGNGSNTCYLLAALDGILHHPQAEKILNMIKITKAPNGYNVKFPGQERAIQVLESELRDDPTIVKTASKGIQLIEQAYRKIPDAKYGAYDTAGDALQRIFGNKIAQPALEVNAITLESAGPLSRLIDEHADLWVATQRTVNQDSSVRVGGHYLSLRPEPIMQGSNLGPGTKFQVIDPYHTDSAPLVTYNNMTDLVKDYFPELIRLQLN